MKMKMKMKSAMIAGLIILATSVCNKTFSQTDTTMVAQADTVAQKKTKEVKEKDGKRRDEFIVYVGGNYSQLNLSSTTYESGSELGFNLGVAYRRGKFLYWQAGALFNNSVYGYSAINSTGDPTTLTVQSIDIPLTGGINILSFSNRIVGLRGFVSAVPAFVIGVNENSIIQKDAINNFLFYGQAGIGVNVAFFIVDIGYNFGFTDLISTEASKPGQLFVNVGFRF